MAAAAASASASGGSGFNHRRSKSLIYRISAGETHRRKMAKKSMPIWPAFEA